MATSGGVPLVDFSVVGDLGRTYKDAQLVANRQRSLAELGKGASVEEVSKQLFAVGDVEGGLSLAKLGDAQAMRQHNIKTDERDFNFRTAEARRTQANADRAHGLQLRQLEEKPKYQSVKGPDGTETIVRIMPDGTATPVNTGVDPSAANPFYTGKQTEGQSNAALYASRMFQAEQILRDPKVLAAATSVGERMVGGIGESVPFGAGNKLVSPEYQQFDQAQRNFINATLRRESGAVINPDEFVNARKQYFPMPGDDERTIAQKQKNRQDAIRGIAAAGGPSYQPPFTFAPDGALVATQPKRAGQAQPANDRPEIVEARTAIAKGADPKKVMRRLQERGVKFNPADLDLQ